MQAVIYGHNAEKVELLLQNGADINAKTDNGKLNNLRYKINFKILLTKCYLNSYSKMVYTVTGSGPAGLFFGWNSYTWYYWDIYEFSQLLIFLKAIYNTK